MKFKEIIVIVKTACVWILLLSLLLGSQFLTAIISDSGDPSANVIVETNMGYPLGTKGNQIFYHDVYWFAFYFNGSALRTSDGAILYKTSLDGESWSDPKIAANDENISAYFSVYQFDDTVVVAYSSMPPTDPTHNCVVRTRKGVISASTIIWDDPVVLLDGYEIGQTIGNFWGDYAFGKHWLAVEYLYYGSAYECKIFSTTDFSSWDLSKDWQTLTSGYVFQVTLKYVENSRLMALYGSWLLNEFSYMFYNGSDWSSEYQTSGSGLAFGRYKAQCEVVVNGTMYMLYSLWDYVTNLKLAIYNGTWFFSDFLPDNRYWGGASSATLDRNTGTIYFFYVDADKNEVLVATSANYADWCKGFKLHEMSFDAPRWTKTPKFCDGHPAVVWVEGLTALFRIKFKALSPILPTSLSVSLGSSTSYIGFKVEIKGNLTYNGTGLQGAPILLSYSVTGGETWNEITLVKTASDGSYSAVWMPSASGNYLVKATWSGNLTYLGTCALTSLAVTPFEERSVFSVASNSTISELVFDSISGELSLTVTGPSGTHGYVEVYMAKTLVDNASDIKVYLDGNQLNYTVTSQDDSWLLYFTYIHSTHKISINLGVRAGDVDGDGYVGPMDLDMFASAYGKREGQLGYNSLADLDRDGYIGPIDLNFLAAHYGKLI